MRHDMNLVREMLLGAADATGPLDASVYVDEGHDSETVCEHVRLLDEAGLIDGTVNRFLGGDIRGTIERLTWEGNEFLDTVANEAVWKKVRMRIAQLAGAATFELTKALAVQELSGLLLRP